MRSIGIVPSPASAVVKAWTMESNKEGKCVLICDYDEDEDTTVASTATGRCGSMSSHEALDESMISCGIDEPSESLSKPRVSFGTLEIHEYAMELGGSGIPRMGGAPVTLSRERQAHYEVMVTEYDDLKGQSRTGEQLFLHPKHRMSCLLKSGFTMQEIHAATAVADEIRIRRQILASKGPSPLKKIKGVMKKLVGRSTRQQ